MTGHLLRPETGGCYRIDPRGVGRPKGQRVPYGLRTTRSDETARRRGQGLLRVLSPPQMLVIWASDEVSPHFSESRRNFRGQRRRNFAPYTAPTYLRECTHPCVCPASGTVCSDVGTKSLNDMRLRQSQCGKVLVFPLRFVRFLERVLSKRQEQYC